MDKDIAIKVENVSKKFSRSLKSSMVYGMMDVGKNMLGKPAATDKLRKNEFLAVDNVSFEVKRGETLGLIGANGSGKTTMLKMLNGIFWPDHGKISIRGRVGALIAVGAGFHPMLTGRENIYLNAAIMGMNRRHVNEKFDQIVEFADIGDFLDTPVKHYSSGMFVRLGFAVAVHCDPDILLVDEVLAVGDSKFRRKCSEKMTEFIESGEKAIVLVSHNMQSIEAIANKAVLFEHGQVVSYGEVSKVTAKYDLLMRPNYKTGISVQRKAFQSGLPLINKFEGYSNDEIYIEKVWMEDHKGNETSELEGDMSANLCVSYVSKGDENIENGYISFAFINEMEINCMGGRVKFGEEGMPAVLPTKGTIKVRINPLQLTTSEYKISILIHDKTYTTPYAQGHFGFIGVKNTKPTLTPGLNTPVCWPKVEWLCERK